MKNKILTKIAQFFKKANADNRCNNKDLSDEKSLPLTEEFERCVMCGALTGVPISMLVDLRENYEIGLGQLCAECAKLQSESTLRENTLTNAQILQAVEQSRKETNRE